MLIEEIDKLIPSVMKEGNKDKLNAIKAIKVELMKAKTEKSKDYVLSKEEEDKILLKMVSSLKESIEAFKKANRKDLVEESENQLNVIKTFAPDVVDDNTIQTLTEQIITAYIEEKGANFQLSMKDMKPIMTEVKKTYPTANGKVISDTLKSFIN